MRRTDYDVLAKHYDAPWRTNVAPDMRLEEHLRRSASAPFRVLDVGCGTGAWLLSQAAALACTNAELHGIEPSAGMLALARAKDIRARLAQAAAESIPYRDGWFDYVVTRLAYHHFENKSRAFDEILRVLKPGGTFVLSDMVPERARKWIVYRFFPKSYELDLERFLPLEQLQVELERRGCQVVMEMSGWEREVDWGYVHGYCQGRGGTSSLQILTDEEFEEGLSRIQRGREQDPEAKIVDGMYAGDLIATKPD